MSGILKNIIDLITSLKLCLIQSLDRQRWIINGLVHMHVIHYLGQHLASSFLKNYILITCDTYFKKENGRDDQSSGVPV